MNTTGNVRMNVTLRCVRVAIVALQKEKVLHIMSASLFLVIYHVVRMRSIILSVAVRLYHISPHLINGTTFGKRRSNCT